MTKLRDILFENPDSILPSYNNKHELGWYTNETVPFGYYHNKMLIGNFKTTHGGSDGMSIANNLKKKDLHRNDFTCVGRIWTDNEVISFWNIDKPLDQIIKDINTASKLRGFKFVINDSWLVDTLNFAMYKLQDNSWGYERCSVLIPLGQVINDVDKYGEAENYTISWKDYDKYYNILHER